jgi:hypothetical protein
MDLRMLRGEHAAKKGFFVQSGKTNVILQDMAARQSESGSWQPHVLAPDTRGQTLLADGDGVGNLSCSAGQFGCRATL